MGNGTIRDELHQLVDQVDESDLVVVSNYLRRIVECESESAIPPGKPFTFDDALWDIVGMIKGGPSDISENHDKYLAAAYMDTHEE